MFSGGEYGAPETMGPVLLLPLLFTFFAIAGRVAARTYWRNFGKRKPHWWYVYPLLALALYSGMKWVYFMWNPDILERTMYLQTLITNKVKIAHYLAFLIPLITTIWIVLYDRREAQRERTAVRP
ncbi:hypothetical protein EON79_23680 [bacterium]|nr:MAG: hypothetical protein EON79_23680 [bacterium]